MTPEAEFNTDDLRFWVGSPWELHMDTWRQMQTVTEVALIDDNPSLLPEEIDWIVHKGDVGRFAAGRINPLVDVREGRLNNGEFKRPTVVAAFNSANKIIGYNYSADNTSGDPAFVRQLKMRVSPSLPIPKFGHRRYAWIRETMVDPQYQHRGVAHVLGYLSLDQRHARQPVTVYEWQPTDKAIKSLKSLGLEMTGTRTKERYGKGSKTQDLVRFEAPEAQTVMANIQKFGHGAVQAIINAQKSRHQYL